MDGFPVLSQIKSLIQVIKRDTKGARETQINFSRQCPIVSQIRSIVEASMGDKKAARETQEECGQFLLSMVEATPIVGHVLGTAYYITGNKERGDSSMKGASRSTVSILGGAVGFMVTGPPGAIAGAVIGGGSMDLITTSIDSLVHKEFRPQGILMPIKYFDSVVVFETMCLVGADMLTGYTIGKLGQKIKMKSAGTFKKGLYLKANTINTKGNLVKCNQFLKSAHNMYVEIAATPLGALVIMEITNFATNKFFNKRSHYNNEDMNQHFESNLNKIDNSVNRSSDDQIIGEKRIHIKKKNLSQSDLSSLNLEETQLSNDEDVTQLSNDEDVTQLSNDEDVAHLNNENQEVNNGSRLCEIIMNGRKYYFFGNINENNDQKVALKRSHSCYF